MPVELVRGNSPLLVTLPYTGTNMPRMFVDRLREPAQFFSAPDRFLSRLLGSASHQINTLEATFHRYISDVDYLAPTSPPDPRPRMVGTVPLLDASGAPVWDHPPGEREAASWRAMYYAPYHAALAAQLARMRALFGHVVILNLHARHDLMSTEPGTKARQFGMSNRHGASCDTGLSMKLINLLQSHDDFDTALNTGARPSWTLRHYGRPAARCHAIDLEISEACYLTQSDDIVLFDSQKAEPVRHLLDDVMVLLDGWRPN